MSIRASVSLVLLFFYALVLSLSLTLYWAMILPLIVEVWRNFKEISVVLKKLLFLNIFLSILAISVWLMGDKHLAILIFFRSNFTIFFALLLFHKKDAFDIALGLQELKMPYKLNALFFFVAKFIFLLHQNLVKFKNSLHVRGFLPKTSLFTYKTYANFVGMLFINALKEAKSLENLMTIRGFSGKLYSLKENEPLKKYEFFLIIAVVIALTFQKGVLL